MRKDERDAMACIAAEVRRARNERGWSQLELAERASLSLNYVSLIERAEQLPTVRVLLQLAAPLGVTLRDLVSGSMEKGEVPDPWLAEATAVLQRLPDDARPVALGVLRAVEGATTPRGPSGKAQGRRLRAKGRR
jgi:transcriptional regulator with XRE-family HTH domain